MRPAVSTDLITRSFELAAERCDDLVPLVYQRLFREHPELEQFFVMDRTGAARGSMLTWVINALLDSVGEDSFGENLIRAEMTNHSGMGVEREQFMLFFGILAITLQDVLGPNWTPDMGEAWQHLLADLERILSTPAP